MVGLSPDFEKAEQLLQKVLSLADDKEMVVKMGKPQQAYISLFSYKIDMNFTLERIDWSSVADGIRLSGKQKLINSGNFFLLFSILNFFYSFFFRDFWGVVDRIFDVIQHIFDFLLKDIDRVASFLATVN